MQQIRLSSNDSGRKLLVHMTAATQRFPHNQEVETGSQEQVCHLAVSMGEGRLLLEALCQWHTL